MRNKLLVLTRNQQLFYQELSAADLSNLEIFAPESEAELSALVPECNIFLANPILVKKHISAASSLAWLQSVFTGVDALCADDMRQDYLLTNVREVFGQVMAEYVFAYILSLKRKVIENYQNQAKKDWVQEPYGMIRGKTIAVLGTGSIGREIASIARVFGMKVIGFSRSGQATDSFSQVYKSTSLLQEVAQADYVVSALPLTNETSGLLDREFFIAMNNAAVFINVGRGASVIEADLISALQEGEIANAVLDVFTQEPLPVDSQLWETEGLYITPHVSGYSSVEHHAVVKIFKQNYQLYLEGNELGYQVDFTKGY